MISLLLLLLYPLAIQYERGGWWRLVAPITAIALVVDILANYTELALLFWDWPQEGEYTFSLRLRRLQHNDSKRGELAWYIAYLLNWISPSGKHVPQ